MVSINSNEAFIGIAFSRTPGSPLHAKSLGPITCVLLLVVEPLAAFAPALVYATWGLEFLYGSDVLHIECDVLHIECFYLACLRSLNSTIPHFLSGSCSSRRQTIHLLCSFSITLSACANFVHRKVLCEPLHSKQVMPSALAVPVLLLDDSCFLPPPFWNLLAVLSL